jgi:hypothetical protein
MTTDRKGSENPRAAALERSFIETGASPDGLISVYVVFPATRAVLTRFPLRQVAYSALLKVHDGSVWMLRATGQAWTLRRLSAAALTICSATRAGLAREELRRCLAHRLKIPSVSLQDPIFERADPDHWNTRETAEALLARLSRLTNGRFEKPAQPSFEQRLQDALDMAVRDLVEGMNPEVCRSALRGGRINAAIYNYLIPEEHRTYRMQFAATFPILLLPMATALAGTAEADIRLAVDRGIPLTRSLAARWRIRPAVVRFLVGKTPDIVGAQWESNLAGLARLLDALRPEDLPGNHPDARAAFNRAVALAERIFRRRSWASPAALAWLREVARRGWICHDGDPEAEALGPESIAAIHQFPDGLFQTLLAGTCGSSAGRDSGASADVEEAADRVLAQMRPRRLAQVAKRFELELARAKADLSTDIGVLRGASFWPLIPAAYVSADGSRRIVALTSRKALCVQGTALKICLAYERLDWYARQCRRAASFVLGVLDATSGAPCSTVHIHPSHHLPGAAWHLELLEHTSLRNSPPSAACKRAVRELLRCENVSIQAHLDRGYRVVFVKLCKIVRS